MQYYILFNNHTDGMSLYRKLKQENLYAVIAPTPRKLSVCCGISLMIYEGDLEKIRDIAKVGNYKYLKIEGVEDVFNNQGNKYC